MDLARQFRPSSVSLVRKWVKAWHAGGDETVQRKPKGCPKDNRLI